MSGEGERKTRSRSGRTAGLNFRGPLSGVVNAALNSFGVKTVEQKAGPPRKADVIPHPHSIPLTLQLWLGARLPFVAFVMILGLFTYIYHLAPILPWLLSLLGIMFAIIVCWPPRLIGSKSRKRVDWGLMLSWFVAVGFAVILGLINYGFLESWISSTFMQEFTGVKPYTNPKAVMDAGILTFDSSARLDTTMAAGYKHWFNFCAAPIVNKDDPRAAPVTFWAVGMRCCENRGGFKCDSAEDEHARSGVPVREHNLSPRVKESYDHAVRMAAAANDLVVPEDHIFVEWHKDPKAAGKLAWWFCTVNFGILTLIALCCCTGCQAALTHINVMEHNQD